MPNLLDRLAAKLTRKMTPTAVAMGAENAPTTATPAAVTEIREEESEEAETD
ncbi:MAG TPA: hypothetical protein VFA42_04325 [Gaiellaceae bacterium]|nr:hypothetical protein [Gaiellaceae bacterium]